MLAVVVSRLPYGTRYHETDLKPGMHSMARFLAWLNKYGDSGLALFLAIGVGILTLADI